MKGHFTRRIRRRSFFDPDVGRSTALCRRCTSDDASIVAYKVITFNNIAPAAPVSFHYSFLFRIDTIQFLRTSTTDGLTRFGIAASRYRRLSASPNSVFHFFRTRYSTPRHRKQQRGLDDTAAIAMLRVVVLSTPGNVARWQQQYHPASRRVVAFQVFGQLGLVERRPRLER